LNKDLYFECVEEFADYIIGRIEDDEELFVAIVGKFNTIKPLLKEIMSYEFVDFESIEIDSALVTGYTDEFVLSLWMNDGVIEFGCEKLKRDGEYVDPCGDETYLFEDCSSKIIPLCEDSELYFVNFDEEYDYDKECDKCRLCDCYCDDAEIANTEKSLYYINHKPVSKDEFNKKYKELYKKYRNNMEIGFDSYYELMNDLNDLFIHLW